MHVARFLGLLFDRGRHPGESPASLGPALRSDWRCLVTRPTGEKGLRGRDVRSARPRNPPGAAGEKVAGIDRGRTVKPHAQPSDRRTSLGTAAADRSSPAPWLTGGMA